MVRVDLVENDELLVIISGKQPMIKLLPRAAISSTESGEDTEMIKIPETKGNELTYLLICSSVCLSDYIIIILYCVSADLSVYSLVFFSHFD